MKDKLSKTAANMGMKTIGKILEKEEITDKFEEIIKYEFPAKYEKTIKFIANKCNTLHQQAIKEERGRHIRIYRWLLGYNSFPRREQERPFYWRPYLRKKLKNIGITIK